MAPNSSNANSWPAKLVFRMGRTFRSNKSYTQEAINKQNARDEAKRQERRRQHAKKHGYQVRDLDQGYAAQSDVNELGERRSGAFSEAPTLVERPKDHTDMMHRLAHHDSFDSLVDGATGDKLYGDVDDDLRPRRLSPVHEKLVESLPASTWKRIAFYLQPADAARLGLANRSLYRKLGPDVFRALNTDANMNEKIAFLQDMDRKLPRHLLCFVCAAYHLRLQPGKETYKADYNTNPIFICPRAKESVLPRLRLVHGRELPYAFIQLALRHARYSPAHGIPHENLARRWKCKTSPWSHRSRYMIHDNRLLMRIVSQTFAPPAATLTETGERHLLYDREEYVPFFSVCAHWRDGDLMKICKCALSHIPAPPQSYREQLKNAPTLSRRLANPEFLVTGCDFCRPARRCPECPTEYLVEVQMLEDLKDSAFPFKHALVVSRWSDLGDASNPVASPEYAAIRGADPAARARGFKSFSHVGRRAVAGIFESQVSGWIPGQRMVNLNPQNEKMGESGHGWY